ncbi:MAG: hydrogenase [Candidatus Omnitrophica bacterium]|nr:hydrogenase [Candidatus Omnitrophota bacterium]
MLTILILMPFLCALGVLLPVSKYFRLKLFGAVSLAHSLFVASFWKEFPPSEYHGFLVLDSLGLILLSIISFLFLSVSIFMIGYFKHELGRNRVFVTCLFLLLSMMTLVAVSYHFGLLWVAIEATTLFSAPLISFHRSQQSLQATWRYLLICSVGIALALMGTFFLAIAAHDVHTLLLPALLKGAPLLSVNWLKLSIIFFIVGYGCKMGLAPTHSWKPEAYGQAPGMVAVLMAGALTQCSFLALLRIAQICNKTGLTDFFSSILILSGVLSLIVPAMFILGERNIKRAFAYSSIEHMGLLVLGLGLGTVGLFGALFHMINNALAKVVMFLTAGSLAQKYGSASADEIRGVIHIYPLTGVFLIAALLAGTGMFPFATFHSELLILNAAIISKHYLMAAVGVVCLGLMFIGIGKIILNVIHGQPKEPLLAKKENIYMNVAIAMAGILLISIGLWMPSPLEKLLHNAAALIVSV